MEISQEMHDRFELYKILLEEFPQYPEASAKHYANKRFYHRQVKNILDMSVLERKLIVPEIISYSGEGAFMNHCHDLMEQGFTSLANHMTTSLYKGNINE